MKRNCNGCKALIEDFKFGQRCSLGYKIEILKLYYGIPVSYKPLEKCPKPKTFKEFVKYNLK